MIFVVFCQFQGSVMGNIKREYAVKKVMFIVYVSVSLKIKAI